MFIIDLTTNPVTYISDGSIELRGRTRVKLIDDLGLPADQLKEWVVMIK